jgi:hypothetical protein
MKRVAAMVGLVLLSCASLGGTCLAGPLQVQYANRSNYPAANQIQPHFIITNSGGTAVPLSSLKLRYFYSKEGNAGEQLAIDWAERGVSNVTTSLQAGYFELGFAAAAGSMAANGTSGQVQVRLHKTDWSAYDQSNDFSFNQSMTSFQPWNKVALYQNGKLVWGSAPGNLPSPDTVKVLVVTFDPVLESRNGVRLHTYGGWNDPATLSAGYLQDIQAAAGGKMKFQIVDWKDIDAVVPAVGGGYTEDTYLGILDAAKAWEAQGNGGWWGYPGWINYSFDYNGFVQTYNIPARVEAGEVDEVWVFAHPYAGMYESQMIGRTAFFCNSSPIYRSDSRNFIVMGFNYERGVAEMLEDLGHRTESIMAATYGRWSTNPYYPRFFTQWPRVSTSYSGLNLWEKYTLGAATVPEFPGSVAQCGSIHYTPNATDLTTQEYVRDLGTSVSSGCDNWLNNFPALSGAPRNITCSEWNCDSREYMKWWFTHLPKADGTNPDGKQNNWWKYITLR